MLALVDSQNGVHENILTKHSEELEEMFCNRHNISAACDKISLDVINGIEDEGE